MNDVNWNEWKHRRITPWQGCLLSLGLNPNGDWFESNLAPGFQKIRANRFPNKDSLREFERRQSLIFDNKDLISEKDISDINAFGHWKVKISAFVRLALDLEMSLPPEFAAFATLSPPSQSKEKWPWGSYENQALRAADAAIRKWWINYDPADYTSAPTISDVSEWIQKEFKMSTHKATEIARVINADDLKSGPRR